MGLFGKALESEIDSTGEDIKFLADGFIPIDSVTQFFAGDGQGKSTLILQAELEASSALPIYGEFDVSTGYKVLHIQTERPAREAYQRMILMKQKFKMNFENFYFEAGFQGHDISHLQDRTILIDKMKRIKDELGGIDWVHIDPIYALTSGDLSTSNGANEVNDFIRKIQKDICKTVTYNHHPNRGVRDKETGERIGEDMYGNRFLSANCTGVYHIKGKKGGGGTLWECKKDSYSCLTKNFELCYDSQYYLSYLDSSKAFSTKSDRIISFLKICKNSGKLFSFDEFTTENNVSTTYGRVQISVHMNLGNISIVNPNDKKYLYKSNIG